MTFFMVQTFGFNLLTSDWMRYFFISLQNKETGSKFNVASVPEAALIIRAKWDTLNSTMQVTHICGY